MRYKWLKMWAADTKEDVLELQGGNQVRMRVVVTSAEKDTDFVFLRYGFNLTDRKRVPLECVFVNDNGDGTYTRVFQTYSARKIVAPMMHFHRGFFHLNLDAMTRSTLFTDDVNNYSVTWWGVPYRVF
jgi:hypothetical protein